ETGIEIPTEFTVAVSEESENVMKNAAEKLIGLSDKEIRKIAEDIISGRLKDFFADFVYLNALSKRKDLYFQLAEFIEAELGKAGLKLAGMSNGGAV
ncbi:MAG: hypothetical protein LBQ27_00685, partial [Clostridiales bacterium]|nr:hypothetical protein [Clostridiales bacterium]